MAEKTNAPNWKKIKAEYLNGGISQQKLADKYGVPYGTLHRKALLEKWSDLKKQAGLKADQKLTEKMADIQADAMAQFTTMQTKAAAAIYQKVLTGIEKFPDGAGTKTVRETVDVKKIKQDDGTEKVIPLRSSFTSDIESAARTIALLGKLYGLDAASILAQQRYEAEQARDGKLPDIEDTVIFDEIRKCMEDKTP